MKATFRLKGGPGSGHHGHSGRPGKVGGSSGGGKVWGGSQEQFDGEKVSKLQTGEIGEQLAETMLEEQFGVEFRTLNEGINNAPIDVAGDHMAVEVKTGLTTNGATAQHWRATLGQFGKGERERVSKLSKPEKKEYLAFRRQQIMERKYSTVAKMSNMLGEPVKPFTVGVILTPDGSKGDVFMVPDFHLRLTWKNYATDEFYIGTYDVE